MASSSAQPKFKQRVVHRSDRRRPGRVSRDEMSNKNNIIQPISMPSSLNTNYQIDVSYPSATIASPINIEAIKAFLISKGFPVENSFNIKPNESFHRCTLQLKDNDTVNDLLARSSISYNGFHLKFKQTDPIIDLKSYILQATIDSKRGSITREKFSSYIDILNNNCVYKLTDLSSPLEQILLIQCDRTINFDQLCRVQKSRRQVRGVNVSLKQVYEIDTAIIESSHTILSSTMIQNIVESVYENVFTFTITSNQAAFIEFIRAEDLEKWLSHTDETQQNFNVNIKPRIKYVKENDRTSPSHHSSTSQSIKSTGESTAASATIDLNRKWAIIAGHPRFSIEYKDYIRTQTGFEIDIYGNKVHIHCTPARDTCFDKSLLSRLKSQTNNFMQGFVFRSINVHSPKEQLAILCAHSPIVAFRRNRRNTFLIAARNLNMKHLIQKLLPQQSLNNKPIDHPFPERSAARGPTKPTDQKQTLTSVLPPQLMNSIITDDKSTKRDEIITNSMALPNHTPAQIALFANKTFENCLKTHFDETYNIKINFEPTTCNNPRPLIKMVGQEKSVNDATTQLLLVISLFRTKIFEETADNGWIKITDVIRVIQHQFKLLNIICVCQQGTSPVSIIVHHIDKKYNKLGVSEQFIETLCQKKLILTTYKPTRFGNEWTTLKTEILRRSDYGKDICFSDEQQAITLYGVSSVVKDVLQQLESINKTEEKLNHTASVVGSEPIKSLKAPNEKVFIPKPPLRQSHIKHSPIQESNIQHTLEENLSIQRPSKRQSSVQKLVTQQSPIQKPSTQPQPKQQTPKPILQQSPIQKPPIQPSPIQQMLKTVVQQSNIQESLIQKPPIQPSPIQQMLKTVVQQSNIQESLIQKPPIQPPHIQQTPKPILPQSTIQESPIQKPPMQSPPIQSSPIQQMLKTVVQQSTIQESPIQKRPIQPSPIQQMLKTVVQQSNIQDSSIQKLPIQPPHIQQTPKPILQQSTIQEPPTQQTPKMVLQQSNIQQFPAQQPVTQQLRSQIFDTPVRAQLPVSRMRAQLPVSRMRARLPVSRMRVPASRVRVSAEYYSGTNISSSSAQDLPVQKPLDLNVSSSLESSKSDTQSGNNQIITPQLPKRLLVFHIDKPGFEILINQETNQLLAITNSKCLFKKEIMHQLIQIQIPKAKVYELEDNISDVQSQVDNTELLNASEEMSTKPTQNWFFSLFERKKPNPPQQDSFISQVVSTSTVNNAVNIISGKSKIIVCIGDLTKQAVDLIVVCSTSRILCDSITSAAGSEVKNIYNHHSSVGILIFETPGGNLPCKNIIFCPWTCNKNPLQDLKQSIIIFVESIITHAIRHNLSTIAFPSIGCGQLGHDPKIIAEYMLGETFRQIKTSSSSQLIVSFVLLPEQKNVYDAFVDELNTLKNIDDTPTSISFDKQTVKITLIGSDVNELYQCEDKIKQLAESCSHKLHLTEKTDMADWPQNTIQKYYEYCLQKRVIPTLDIQNATIDLIGPKDALSDADKYYFQLTADTLRNARIQVISRGFIWSVEVSPGKWEQYSYKINELIEDAKQKNLLHVDFMNEGSKRFRIIFSKMEEQYQQQKRAVRRKRIDSSLPNTWDLSGGNNFKRIALLDSSKEYKDVVSQFDKTMKGQYVKVIKIERIQNERWYKQYAAHRDEFTQRHNKPDERLLFHGCSSVSAEKIVHECFNRSFAGVNGVVYGCGVYFHEHANYSHNYTKSDLSTGRTMFLARVLIGKVCIGNPTMRVPPEGHDTTTDGKHIFVVYHDAAAYGEHLITYR